MLSRARACGVSEENNRAARVACDGMDFKASNLGFL